jgi:hypothetical protein
MRDEPAEITGDAEEEDETGSPERVAHPEDVPREDGTDESSTRVSALPGDDRDSATEA